MAFFVVRRFLGQPSYSLEYGERPGATVQAEINAGKAKRLRLKPGRDAMGLYTLIQFYEAGVLSA